jgi:hypothetical protein
MIALIGMSRFYHYTGQNFEGVYKNVRLIINQDDKFVNMTILFRDRYLRVEYFLDQPIVKAIIEQVEEEITPTPAIRPDPIFPQHQ